jgi:hypothetical protein
VTGRNALLIVTVAFLAATLSVALPNLRVEIAGPEEESMETVTIVSR